MPAGLHFRDGYYIWILHLIIVNTAVYLYVANLTEYIGTSLDISAETDFLHNSSMAI